MRNISCRGASMTDSISSGKIFGSGILSCNVINGCIRNFDVRVLTGDRFPIIWLSLKARPNSSLVSLIAVARNDLSPRRCCPPGNEISPL